MSHDKETFGGRHLPSFGIEQLRQLVADELIRAP